MKNLFLFLITIAVVVIAGSSVSSQSVAPRYDVFSFEQSLNLPGSPEVIFDAITGDLSGWWDHTFSKNPYRLYIEPKPGGGFYEIFDEQGNGVQHATVIYADRGKLLRFEGPLGFSGKALQLVCTYSFAALGADSTTLTLSVHGAGETQDNLPAIIETVWSHFLVERFKPWIEAKDTLNIEQ